MNKKIKKYYNDYSSALDNLGQTFSRSQDDDVVVDAAIKRFELSYELSWKLIKAYLFELGVICKNPRECFKEAQTNGLIQDEIGWLNMIEDRNLLVHTYSLERSRAIFDRVKDEHYPLLRNLSEEFSERLN